MPEMGQLPAADLRVYLLQRLTAVISKTEYLYKNVPCKNSRAHFEQVSLCIQATTNRCKNKRNFIATVKTLVAAIS